jgi:hypothetical protein
MKRMLAVGWGGMAVLAVACGNGGGAMPGARTANDVETSGMNQTFAGKNKCNPKTANRPFIIEWDATDASSFEARAGTDIIVVKYEGCDLQVLDGCANDVVKGSLGAYKPVEWTSGSLESLDINNDGDLFTKLPLGASSLGGRVEGGEKFHMEYFVSGTRSATREAVYEADLAKVPGCKEATHFVYAYNLGAFALGAQSNIKGNINGSVFGFGAGADRSSSSKADKKGGVLSSCRGESAKELDTCKVPIRLTLREISPGASAEAAEAQAPETPTAKNLAGKIQASSEREHKAADFYTSASTKSLARDGRGCLLDLDQHDRLDPRPEYLSTSPTMASLRAQCLMLSGQCPAGKQLARRFFERAVSATLDSDGIDRAVESFATTYCQGGAMTPREQLLKAKGELERGAHMKRIEPAACMSAYQTEKRLLTVVQPQDAADTQITIAGQFLRSSTVGCLARAGDCNAAWSIWQKEPNPFAPAGITSDRASRAQFDTATQHKCPP